MKLLRSLAALIVPIAAALALAAPINAAAQQTAQVVSSCASQAYPAPGTNYITVDTSGDMCTNGTFTGTVTANSAGKATAAPPSYGEGTTDPLSMNLSGNLRVLDATVNTSLGTLITNLGTPMQNSGGTVGISGTLPAYTSTPTFNCGTGCSGSNASVSTTGAAVPGSATYVGIISGGNLTGWTGHVTVDSAPTTAVTGTFWQATQPVSAAALPLPTGAATSALQTTGNSTLTSINSALGGTLTVQGPGTAGSQSGGVLTIQGDPSGTPIPITGSVTAGGVAQGSTTSGQSGNLVQGAVTTSAPTYTTGKTNPISLDTSGNLRVSLGSATVPISLSNYALETGGNLASILTAVQASIPAGANIIGKIGIDQTTPGTSNAVFVTNSSPSPPDDVITGPTACATTGTCTALTVSSAGAGSVGITVAGSGTGIAFTFQGAVDPTTPNYTTAICYPTGSAGAAAVTTGAANGSWLCPAAGYSSFRLNWTGLTGGTVTETLNASAGSAQPSTNVTVNTPPNDVLQTCTATSGSHTACIVNSQGSGGATIAVTGSGSGMSYLIEGSTDGTNYVPISAFSPAGVAVPANTAQTANGNFIAGAGGWRNIEVLWSTLTGGTATVNLNSSAGSVQPFLSPAGVPASDITAWGAVNVAAATASGADGVTNTKATPFISDWNYAYNGTTWDRERIDAGHSLQVAGEGTAGSAAGGVVTVQGVASMTPVLVTPSAPGDPCFASAKSFADFESTTSGGSIITAVSAKKAYICSVTILTSASTNVSLIEGTGSSVCTGGTPAGVFLNTGTTAANGAAFSANGGVSFGAGIGTLAANATANQNICVIFPTAGSPQVNVHVAYVQQ